MSAVFNWFWRPGVSSASSERFSAKRLCAGAALIIAIAIALIATISRGTSMPGSPIDQAKSFLAMMKDRSPGARTAAELRKTKQIVRVSNAKPAAQKAERSSPRELFDVLTSPPVPMLIDIPALSLPELPLFSMSFGNGPEVAILSSAGGGEGGLPPAAGGIIVSPGGGGGGGGGGSQPDIPGSPPPNSITAVPEPSTWMMMLLGFTVVGWRLRSGGRLLRRREA